MQEAVGLLMRFFAFPADLIREEALELETSEWDPLPLETAYHALGPSVHTENNLAALRLLVGIVRRHPEIGHAETDKKRKDQMRRQDLMNLLLLCETTKPGDVIIVKNHSRSFQLTNESRWFIEELLAPFVRKALGDDCTAEKAVAELANTGKRHRGRQTKAPQMMSLIWGIYLFLTERHGFRTPMPNALCNFIIRLLQLMDLLPEQTEIDSFWIRAQLRYMQSRKVKSGFSPA